jgi:hypothetical protein
MKAGRMRKQLAGWIDVNWFKLIPHLSWSKALGVNVYSGEGGNESRIPYDSRDVIAEQMVWNPKTSIPARN